MRIPITSCALHIYPVLPTSHLSFPAPQGGAIGKNFTTELRECLTHVSSLKPEEVHEQYGYPVLRMADAVRNRSIGERPRAGARKFLELCRKVTGRIVAA